MQYRFLQKVVYARLVKRDATLIIMVVGDRDDRNKTPAILDKQNPAFKKYRIQVPVEEMYDLVFDLVSVEFVNDAIDPNR